MKIFFCRAEAFAWKKLVFLYLDRSQLTRDRQCHMSSSFSSHQLRSSLVLFISLLISTEGGWDSSHSSLFCSSATLRPTCPKTILFHASRWLRHLSRQLPNKLPVHFAFPSSRPFVPPLHTLDLSATLLQI